MITNQTEMPLDSLVGELFGRASRKHHLATAGWVLAIGAHAAAALLFATRHQAALLDRTLPPVEMEFIAPPEPPPPPPPEAAVPEEPKAAPTHVSAAAPPAAARAGALHLAKPDAAPAQQAEEAVDFTTDPHGASYGGGVVAVGGTGDFGATGARAVPVAGKAPLAPVTARPVGDALTPASDLSRKPRLPGGDPCRGFFPSSALDDVGDVGVMVTIAKSGRVSQAQLVSESPRGQGFGAAARTCLASQTFVPALDRAGNAAATAIRVNLRFSR
ncbi:MAG TPA: energy transducer TonB [Polyangiaceae bacterium]|nr:energy transducer TonB [Polyangiaceae bacterium]